MKSNICELSKNSGCIETVLNEVEKAANYNNLESKKALRLRLLAEELCGMLPGLVAKFSGRFWLENDGNSYELHVELEADDMSLDTRNEIVSVSKSGKNAAAKGIMGKIRAVAETMLLAASDPTFSVPTEKFYDYHGFNMGFGYLDAADDFRMEYMHFWSLAGYKSVIEEEDESEAKSELERSIVAKLADDIIIGVRGNNVDIVVKKTF